MTDPIRTTHAGRLAGAVLLAAALLSAPAAHAQGFFGWGWGRDRAWSPWRQSRPIPQVHFSGPKYYTYQPDQPISLAEFARSKEAAADAPSARLMAGPYDLALKQGIGRSLRMLPEVAKGLRDHYAAHPAFLWVGQGRANQRAREVLAALAQADRYGLAPQDYAIDPPDTATADELIGFEVDLSARLLTYVLDATRGRIDPNRISGYHDFERKTVDLAGALESAAAASDIGAWLAARNPDNAPFKALEGELVRLRAAAPVERVEIAEGTFLKPGQASPEVANVVAAIRLAGSEALKARHATILASYSGGAAYAPELVDLVRDFQKEAGLSPDGIVGRNTIAAMVPSSNADRILKVELAMERLRWLPRELGARYVFINQPAYTATYMREGREPLSMRAVVGSPRNQTYFFTDRIETVEYNPYWGVPLSIIVNEMLPQLSADPSYLDRLGYEVTTVTGQRISSASVDWYAVATNAAAVDVRQPPGPGNALGRLKILFPNAHAIYMHDTPQKELFKQARRAFSHGCVRLEHPREMAAAVLDTSVDYIDQRIAQGRNDSDDVRANIPVYVAYFTAWPTPQGAVEYFDDVYGRDDHLATAIARTDAARHAEG